MIPLVSADKIVEAMQQFDTQLRNTQEWANWEQNQVHKYAIEHHGIRYPVKQVVSLKPGDKTHLNDLRLVCANCHRMIHARRSWLSMEELRGILSA